LRGEQSDANLSRDMAQATPFPRHIILAAASITGVLLALAVHMLGVRFGLDLGGLWRNASVPTGAALAWWLIAAAGFGGGYLTATLLRSAVSGTLPPRLRQFIIVVGLLVLAGAGQVAAGPSPIPTFAGFLAAVTALALGGLMAVSGAYFALKSI
jgi:hypothetical protein